ncbi:MAG: collagen-like protein [Bacillota bacterium]
MADFLNESNGAKTSARDNGSGEPITDVSIADNSEQNPLYVKGLQGDPAVIGEKSIVHEMLGEKSVRSINIGTGSVMMDHLNSEVKNVLDGLQKQIDELKPSTSAE